MHFYTATAGSSSRVDNTPSEKMTILGSGYVGIGTTNPSALFSVGSTSQFQVNSTGGITSSAFSSNGGPLYTNGTGVFAQVTAGAATTVLHGGATPSFSAVSLTSDIAAGSILPTANGGLGANMTAGAVGAIPY